MTDLKIGFNPSIDTDSEYLAMTTLCMTRDLMRHRIAFAWPFTVSANP